VVSVCGSCLGLLVWLEYVGNVVMDWLILEYWVRVGVVLVV